MLKVILHPCPLKGPPHSLEVVEAAERGDGQPGDVQGDGPVSVCSSLSVARGLGSAFGSQEQQQQDSLAQEHPMQQQPQVVAAKPTPSIKTFLLLQNCYHSKGVPSMCPILRHKLFSHRLKHGL